MTVNNMSGRMIVGGCSRWRALWPVLAITWLTGLLSACTPWIAVTAGTAGPVGRTNRGVLVGGEALPKAGEGYAFYHDRDRRYGSAQLTALVTEVAQKVAADFPDSVLLVGDLSGNGGGKITGHSSHRTGLDVDLAFFVRCPERTNTDAFLLAPHDPYGVTVSDGHAGYFDYEKNWAVVEALLSSEAAQIQWIFVSKGLKARLLAYALSSGKNMDLVARAADVLHQPGDSAIHNDHFHVRIYCPSIPDAPACEQRKPQWPWVKAPRKTTPSSPSDETLLTLALEGL